jgi:glycine/D-amino acid oxidase-like deaminating enzyme
VVAKPVEPERIRAQLAENGLVARGFRRFKFSPLIGEILADLTTTRSSTHDISRFDSSRFDR